MAKVFLKSVGFKYRENDNTNVYICMGKAKPNYG
jgi:hypothetical protein